MVFGAILAGGKGTRMGIDGRNEEEPVHGNY